MSLRAAAQQALEAMQSFESNTNGLYKGEFAEEITALKAALAEPVQEPFFTEANGFPQTFVPKDRQKQAIISLTDQCAALIQERDELQKQVWLYEKNGVTCQTYRHTVEQSCAECNVQMSYTVPPQRKPLSGLDAERLIEQVIGSLPAAQRLIRAVERAHGIK